jgi:hypothetical protein
LSECAPAAAERRWRLGPGFPIEGVVVVMAVGTVAVVVVAGAVVVGSAVVVGVVVVVVVVVVAVVVVPVSVVVAADGRPGAAARAVATPTAATMSPSMRRQLARRIGRV